MLSGVKPNAGFIFVKTARRIYQRALADVFPERFKRILDILKSHITTQAHLAMHVDFKRGVVACHRL